MGPLLGVVYDDIVSKQWENLFMKLGAMWSVADFTKATQEDASSRSEVLYKSIIVSNTVFHSVAFCMRAVWIVLALVQGDGADQSSSGNDGKGANKGSCERWWAEEAPKENKKVPLLFVVSCSNVVFTCAHFGHEDRAPTTFGAPSARAGGTCRDSTNTRSNGRSLERYMFLVSQLGNCIHAAPACVHVEFVSTAASFVEPAMVTTPVVCLSSLGSVAPDGVCALSESTLAWTTAIAGLDAAIRPLQLQIVVASWSLVVGCEHCGL